jgi:DNA-binding NtrC family response regulator
MKTRMPPPKEAGQVPDSSTTDRAVSRDFPEGAPDVGYALWVVSDKQTSKFALPVSGRVVVGRSRSADVRIDDPSVSREHVVLHLDGSPRIEDLRSINGTRLRGLPLEPGTPVPLRPNDVVDMGAVLLVLRDRALTARGERTCHPALFELHVEEEEARLEAGGSVFAVARLVLEGPLNPRAAEIVVAAALEGKDIACSPEPGHHDVLFFGAEPEGAKSRLARLLRVLSERSVRVQSTLTCYPRRLSPRASRTAGTSPAGPGVTRGSGGLREGPIATDDAMRRVLRLIERVAQGSLSILLLGETGVGKEVCATYVHQISPRAMGPFVRLNCAALPEPLVDAELFGHQRGAFTGAVADRAGLLETASGGTVFLDEIGDMPLTTQVRLLRVLETKEVTPVGSNKARAIDVRVVAATHHDLAERITVGRFREDLYYRLNGISVVVPPLRERPLDIEPLARYFVTRSAQRRRAPALSAASIAVLRSRLWPGNVRELRNVIERAVALCDGPSIEPEHLVIDPAPTGTRPVEPTTAIPPPPVASGSGLREEVDTLERERIVAALAACDGNQRAAARKLGISRGALIRRLDRLGVARGKSS